MVAFIRYIPLFLLLFLASESRFAAALVPSPLGDVRLVAAGRPVELRFLVIATNAADLGLAPIKTLLDHLGAAYQVLLAAEQPLTRDTLIRPDGVGRFNAVLLTNNNLLYSKEGNFVGAFDGIEWNQLWQYERDYGVRQVVMYSSAGLYPEDYCLQQVESNGVSEQGIVARLSPVGTRIFDYLRPEVALPIKASFVYRTKLKPGCQATPILSDERGNVLGVTTTSSDGRERLALTFSQNANLLHTQLLGYGLVRWASKGLFLGEQRMYFGLDVDDWLGANPWRLADGTFAPSGFRISAKDAWAVYLQQLELRKRFPLAGKFTLGMAYNGGGAKPEAPPSCDPNAPSPDGLTSITYCLRDKFRWINHTFRHLLMDDLPYESALSEIKRNIEAARTLGLEIQADMLKTGELSGLGWRSRSENSLAKEDLGLQASNKALLQAAKEAGIRYIHANMSVPSHRPACWNCTLVHPLEPSLTLIPVWPVNIAYDVTTPEEASSAYNATYGPKGSQPYWPKDLLYSEIVDSEASLAFQHILSGSVYTHYLHQSNLHEYAPGRSLAYDWLERALEKYSQYFRVPLQNPSWPEIIAYTQARTSHARLLGDLSAVWSEGTLTLKSPAEGSVFLTTSDAAQAITVKLSAGQPVVLKVQAQTTHLPSPAN